MCLEMQFYIFFSKWKETENFIYKLVFGPTQTQ